MKVIESDKVAPLFRLLLMNNKYADAIIHDVQELVDLQSIDPVHAAGGCYCYECENTCPGNDGLVCTIWGAACEKTGFCSHGIRT